VERQLAETLVDELAKHPHIIHPDKEFFIQILMAAEIPESSEFSEKLPLKEQSLVEPNNNYHLLSLRRVLKNRNIIDREFHEWDRTVAFFLSVFKGYSSDALTTNIRVNGVANLMAECKHPYSLLAKLQSYDVNHSSGKTYRITRPLLIIPQAKDLDQILHWETKHVLFEKEKSLFRQFRRVNPLEYFSYKAQADYI
jgi:hypothetical protein